MAIACPCPTIAYKHVWSCRIPFTHVQELEFTDPKSFRIISTLMTTMRPSNLDVPYGTHKGQAVLWHFSLPYAPLDEFMLQAQKQLAMSRLPRAEREDLLQVFDFPTKSEQISSEQSPPNQWGKRLAVSFPCLADSASDLASSDGWPGTSSGHDR